MCTPYVVLYFLCWHKYCLGSFHHSSGLQQAPYPTLHHHSQRTILFSEQDQNSCGMNRYQVVRGTKQTLTLHRSASQGIKRTAGFRWICWSSVLPNVFLAVQLEMNIHPACSWLQEVAAVSDNTFCLFKRAFIPSQ